MQNKIDDLKEEIKKIEKTLYEYEVRNIIKKFNKMLKEYNGESFNKIDLEDLKEDILAINKNLEFEINIRDYDKIINISK